MEILYFASRSDEPALRLQEIVGNQGAGHRVSRFSEIDSLDVRLRRPLVGGALGVFLAASREEVDRLAALRDLLRGFPVILILNEMTAETVSRGHALAPRYLTAAEENMEDVRHVLSRMLSLEAGAEGCRTAVAAGVPVGRRQGSSSGAPQQRSK